ncbi:glucoamylase [Nocardioides sp. MAH-18]|uniref:Glucoamylase n=1 Tax=Nocardioides agri TaxID=2682843 RepID=A0A6L6XVM0_9ACTN|nr:MULTISPECIES: glycoside hydrolase family 15 protein [unclassified Nocardioides]MBA2955944.1 glucoamylase [Nocardioides sp. CGMCC 1.13656]MVQ50793.1 glucoamylase [Nocardioides sp. MAH-18]
MANRLLGAVAAATAATLAVALLPSAGGSAPAPDRGAKSTWTEADKSGFGTARDRGSNVWFTLQQGRVSEVFYPDLSTPSVRSLDLVVVGDGFVDRPSGTAEVSRPDPASLRYTITHERAGRYRLTQEIVTDPRHDSLVVRADLVPLDGGDYRLYAVHDPALGNDGMDDRARSRPHALVATDGDLATALVSRPALRSTTSGLAGRPSDPLRDLDAGRTAAGPGNVRQAAELPPRVTIALGFGRSVAGALGQARRTVRTDWATTRTAYDRGWNRYVEALRPLPSSASDIQDEYLASALVLAAAEDKLHPGAFVASPSAPWVWGDEVKDLSSPSGAYHLVWSRDLYAFGTALWAMGDRAAARRAVDWLFGTQQKPDGSFPQNSDVAGTPVWGNLQLDEVAFPIVLARLVGKRDAATWRGVRKAAEFLVGFRYDEEDRAAPYTPQERWENQSGYSPSSIAAEVAGLVAAADLARARGHRDLARTWLATADRWQAKVKRWTVTTNGPLSDQPYFLRLTKDGRPNSGMKYAMGDGGPMQIDQRRVVDPSFLDLVRLGLVRPGDPVVRNTLSVVDDELRVDTPNGPFWRRFSHDGYGETRAGGEWVITDPGANRTLGRGWPILTGERGEYAVAAGADGAPYLRAMAAAAGPAGMLSEQVWDGRPPTGSPCCPAGEGTRAATPLVWSHAQLVRLAWTIQEGHPVDQQAVVADRYLR